MAQTDANAYTIYEFTAGDDYYIIVDSGNNKSGDYVLRSKNGGAFEEVALPFPGVACDTAYVNGVLIAIAMLNDATAGDLKDTYTSTDFGDTWVRNANALNLTSIATASKNRSIKALNNEFILVGVGADEDTGYCLKSTDGVTWSEYEIGANFIVARGGLEFSASGLIISGNLGGFYWSSLSTTDLEFADNTNFEDFEINGIYNEAAGAKSALILSKDPDATPPTMSISTDDTFVANADEKLVSHVEVTNAAPDADSLIFTATPYEDTPSGSSSPGTATWDVATSADFSTGLMTDSKAVVRDASNSLEPAERTNITLEDDTEYYTRVTYTSNDGSLSAVSRTHRFKTGTAYVEPDAEIEYVAFSEEISSTTNGSGNIKATYPASMADCNYLVAFVWVDTPNNYDTQSNLWDRQGNHIADRPVLNIFYKYKEETFASVAGTSPNNMFIGDPANSYGVNIMMFGFKITGSPTKNGGGANFGTDDFTPTLPSATFLSSSTEYYGVFANSARPTGGTCTITNVGNQSTANRNNNVSEARGRMTSKLLGSDGAPAANDYKFSVTYSNKGVIGGFWLGATSTSFYNENTENVITQSQLVKTYGRATALPKLGIYNLTDTPSYPVNTYIKQGDKYHPIRDYTYELNEKQAVIESLQTRITAIESDEIVDDAVDSSLLTIIGQLSARVQTLEDAN